MSDCSRHLMLKRTDHGLASRTRMGLARHSTTAHRRGYDLSALRAPSAGPEDGSEFDYVLVMNRGHYSRAVVTCGGAEGFERVLDLIEQACRALLVDMKWRLHPADA